MRKCPYCKINVGGEARKCPVCQNALIGEPTENHWPSPTALQTQSIVYRIQLFLVLAVMIASTLTDFLMGIHPDGIHYSLILDLWLFVFEFIILRLFRKYYSISRVVTFFIAMLTVLIVITSYFFGYAYFYPVVTIFVPIVVIVALVVNFVLAMTDDIANALIYLLLNIFIGIVPYIMLLLLKRSIATLWVVCLIVSLITFAGACVFKGRAVVSELQRRFNI